MKRIALLFLAFLLFTAARAAAAQSPEFVGLRLITVRAEEEAASLLARLRAGEKFEELARTQSLDASGRAGGYLGVLAMAALRPEFRTALDGLNPGQVSPVVRLGRQFALLQLLPDVETRAIELKAWIDAGADRTSPALDRLWAMAIGGNSTEMVKALLAAGTDVNLRFGDGSTLLMGGSQAGQIEIVRALLAAGASPGAQTLDGTTALLLAARAGHAEVVRILLGAGAAANARLGNGGTALADAAFGGHVEVVRILLEAGADPNLTLDNGSTALMAASVKGHNDIVRALLAAGAAVNAGAGGGGTALMEAAYAGQAEMVRILLAAGADARPAMPNGLTALMGAALGGHVNAVRLLLEAGVDVNARDAKGWTALTHARASSSSETVRLLLTRATGISALERSIAVGGTYVNEYYSSNDAGLLDQAAVEFQNVLTAQPQNVAALEWMGAIEFLRWGEAPGMEQFVKASSLLKKSVDLDAKDPDRHYWIAAISSIFASAGKGASTADIAAILDQGIQHARIALELDPQFAAAMDHLSVLYRRKAERVLTPADRDPLVTMADAAHQNADRIRQRLGNRPSRFSDQFSRPSVPAAPKQ